MMGYNEVANQDLTLGDPFKGGRDRRLRPLVPRPFLSSPTPNHNVNTTCLTGFHHNPTNFHNNNNNPSNHHLLTLNNITSTRHQPHFEEGKEGTHQVMVSSRWNPTPEQLRALEELYRRGTRTPSAEQIQHITAQLRRYGKIEGKNVFYWFQNHKARERQKRRRQLQLPVHSPPLSGNKIGIEGEQKSCKWAQSSTNKEECDPPIQVSSEETAGGGLTKSDTTRNAMISEGWIQFHEFQHNHNSNNHNNIISSDKNLLFAGERNSTWQTSTHNSTYNNMVLQPSSCSCCYPSFSLSSKPSNFPSFITSSKYLINHNTTTNNNNYGGDMFGERRSSSPTLQLFPVVRDNDNNNNNNSSSNEGGDGDENIENNSCLTTINNDNHEKGSSVRSSSGGSNKLLECNNNNPFPYYQFL